MTAKDLEKELIALQDQYRAARSQDRPAITAEYRRLHAQWMALRQQPGDAKIDQ